jgi:hypothetical protein
MDDRKPTTFRDDVIRGDDGDIGDVVLSGVSQPNHLGGFSTSRSFWRKSESAIMRFLGDAAGGASVSRKTILVGMVNRDGIRSKWEYY